MKRREFIQKAGWLGAGIGLLSACRSESENHELMIRSNSADHFGEWGSTNGLPVFNYRLDQSSDPMAEWDPIDRPLSRRHFHVMGNRALQVVISNRGDAGVFEENEGHRWLFYQDDAAGAGHSVIIEPNAPRWGVGVFGSSDGDCALASVWTHALLCDRRTSRVAPGENAVVSRR